MDFLVNNGPFGVALVCQLIEFAALEDAPVGVDMRGDGRIGYKSLGGTGVVIVAERALDASLDVIGGIKVGMKVGRAGKPLRATRFRTREVEVQSVRGTVKNKPHEAAEEAVALRAVPVRSHVVSLQLLEASSVGLARGTIAVFLRFVRLQSGGCDKVPSAEVAPVMCA